MDRRIVIASLLAGVATGGEAIAQEAPPGRRIV